MTDQSGRHFILVVEDDDNIALALQFVLQREGWRFDRIASGAAAIDRIRTDRPDLVMLDVMLPEVSGYDICHRVRTDPDLTDVKIIMMTAGGGVRERDKCLGIGADGFLSKPFELRDLRREVRRLMPSGI